MEFFVWLVRFVNALWSFDAIVTHANGPEFENIMLTTSMPIAIADARKRFVLTVPLISSAYPFASVRSLHPYETGQYNVRLEKLRNVRCAALCCGRRTKIVSSI